jgi:hypothetical protein
VAALHGVRVDREGRTDIGMAQDFLRPLRRHAGFRHQGTGQVAHVVEAQRRKTSPAEGSPQDISQELVGVDRPPEAVLVRLAAARESFPRPKAARRYRAG